MKKLLLFILLCIPIMNYAQTTFAPVGAEWWYGGNYGDYADPQSPFVNSTWVDHVKSVGDTVVNGIPCRQLVTTVRSRSADNPDVVHTSVKTTFVYDNTDTAFVYANTSGKFIPLYVYNVSEGDTVRLSGLFNFFGDTTFRYIVDSIRTELYDTSHLKTYYTHTIIDNFSYAVNWGISFPNSGSGPGGWLNKGRYTEKLGGTLANVSGLYPTVTTHATDGRQIINNGPFYGKLRCYTDSAHSISLISPLPCDTLFSPGKLSVNDLEKLPSFLSVSPNPANEEITIACTKTLNTDLTIQIYDITGKRIAEKVLSKGQQKMGYDTRPLPDGLYFLRFNADSGNYYSKMIVQH
ncbi:T9SS type A sorting domain-containing protein [Taibaiella koreensis]|uniref:T9SS type A sorting domain-containing protein n=1 Tax=Taibaiella koreensis TaxID=1268548 RepID=UPI000E599F27|nr:T9SS type A sorting domain-containing protein [Taibaiella koreensis]